MEGISTSVFVGIFLVLVILIAVVIYLLFRTRRKLNLPGELNPDDILQPPTGPAQQTAKTTLEQAMQQSGINPRYYDTDRVVVYPSAASLDEVQFYAAPVISDCDQFVPGMIVGVLYDAQNSYDRGRIVYQIQFFEKTIVLFNDQSEARIVRDDAIFASQDGPHKSTIFFVEGSCSLCGCIDSRCGCLVCT